MQVVSVSLVTQRYAVLPLVVFFVNMKVFLFFKVNNSLNDFFCLCLPSIVLQLNWLSLVSVSF